MPDQMERSDLQVAAIVATPTHSDNFVTYRLNPSVITFAVMPTTRPDRIVRIDGVCGGDAIVAGTRIPVWVLENSRRLGMDDNEILLAYPALDRDSLLAAWEWVLDNIAEIDRLIRKNEQA